MASYYNGNRKKEEEEVEVAQYLIHFYVLMVIQ
jgi:hypothetical protein